MHLFFSIVVIFLLGTICAGLVRLWRGPTMADRLLTTQLFGSTGVAVLIVLAGKLQEFTLLNVAITFNVLAVLLVVCLVRVWRRRSARGRRSAGKGDAA